ncbi:hypothetical protein PMIT1342_00917 [Prochlorococcus marinus str. MIT 1342]|nr:hypothetical protein PMIT1342_00917 [Prochlorococcus marinus str. MIT 1342]
MPRTITRNSKMDRTITFRATTEDVVNLRKAANQEVDQMRDEIALLNGRAVEQQRIIAALTKLGATE